MLRNPNKRLGSGKKDAEEIKSHHFFASISCSDVYNRKIKMPEIEKKKIVKQENISLEVVYGKGAFNECFNSVNKIDEWSFVNHKRNQNK